MTTRDDLAALLAAETCAERGCNCIPVEELVRLSPGVYRLDVGHEPWCAVWSNTKVYPGPSRDW